MDQQTVERIEEAAASVVAALADVLAGLEKATEATLAHARVNTVVGRSLVELLKQQREPAVPNFDPRLTHEGESLEGRLKAVREKQAELVKGELTEEEKASAIARRDRVAYERQG